MQDVFILYRNLNYIYPKTLEVYKLSKLLNQKLKKSVKNIFITKQLIHLFMPESYQKSHINCIRYGKNNVGLKEIHSCSELNQSS